MGMAILGTFVQVPGAIRTEKVEPKRRKIGNIAMPMIEMSVHEAVSEYTSLERTPVEVVSGQK